MFSDYFDHVFCLNLPVRDEKRIEMDYRLKSSKIDFTFWDACRGSAISRIGKLCNDDFQVSVGYLGCLISYLNLFDYALEKGYEKICVIEDDVLIHKHINPLSDLYLPNVPNNADITYYSYIPLSEDWKRWDYNTINSHFIQGSPMGGIFKANNLSLSSTMSFSINQKTMQFIIEKMKEKITPIDNFIINNIQKNSDFNVYGINPQFFIAQNTYSDGAMKDIGDVQRRSLDTRASCVDDYR